MNNHNRRKKGDNQGTSTWIIIGIIALIVLLLFWVDIADMIGAGDGSAFVAPTSTP